MEFFRIKKDIPFMRHALVFNVISLLTFLLAVAFVTRPSFQSSTGPSQGGTTTTSAVAVRSDPRSCRRNVSRSHAASGCVRPWSDWGLFL